MTCPPHLLISATVFPAPPAPPGQQPPVGQLGLDEIIRDVQRYFERGMLRPDVTPQDVAREVRFRADKVFKRYREGRFASSFSDPSMVRPPEQDPLGLAPAN